MTISPFGICSVYCIFNVLGDVLTIFCVNFVLRCARWVGFCPIRGPLEGRETSFLVWLEWCKTVSLRELRVMLERG